MACLRKDIIQRGDETRLKKLEEGVKNKWQWKWLDAIVRADRKKVDDGSPCKWKECVGDSIRKLDQAGVAYCCRCRSDIRYGSRGLVAIQDHIVTTLHQSKASVDNNFLLPGVGPAHSETPYGLNPARCNVQQIVPLPPVSRPLVSMVDRIANQEAILLGFLAEHSLPFSMAPALTQFTRTLGADRKALSQLKMDRTTASYKMTYGLAKTFDEELSSKLKDTFFSLNIDEAFSDNLHKVLTLLVQYPDTDSKRIKVQHLKSVSLEKVNAEKVYSAVTGVLEERSIPYSNLVSVLSDSCAVMRGCRSGFETQLRAKKANHLLDIDGDTVHHANNAAKAFAKPFDWWMETLFRDVHTDFHYAEDWRKHLALMCRMLQINYTTPIRFLSHRFLSAYDGAVDVDRKWKAYQLFYFAFFSTEEKNKYRPVKDKLVASLTDKSKKKINELLILVPKRSMTGDGKARKQRILDRLFRQEKRTQLTLLLYISALEPVKEFVVLFQRKEPQLHILHDQMAQLVRGFLANFVKPEKLSDVRDRSLSMVNITSSESLLPTASMFFGKAGEMVTAAEPSDEVVRSFVKITQKAYQGGAKTLMEKLPLKNEVLLSASALDPRARGHEVALHALLKLPKLVANVAAQIDRVKYEREVRIYQVDQHLPSPECAVDQWWIAVEATGRYSHLPKMALAVLTCFHGPLVESSFNIMGDLMGGRNFRMELPTYSALQTVKYRLGMEKEDELRQESAIKLLAVPNPVLDHPPRNLMKNMKLAYSTYSKAKKSASEGLRDELKQLGVPEQPTTSKRKAQQEQSRDAKRLKTLHLQSLIRKRECASKKAQTDRTQRRKGRQQSGQ